MHWQAFHKKKSLYLKAYLTKYVTTQKRICSKTSRMSKTHTKRILGYEGDRPFWHFFDLKAYLMMACMMGCGIGLRAAGIFPDTFIAFFYTGLGCALVSAGILFLKNHIIYHKLIKKEF